MHIRHLGQSRHLRHLAAALAIVAGITGASAEQARERVAYVSVIDAKTSAPVTDVTADMIAIREDGNRREILRVARATSPMPIAVIVDNSQAMSPAIADLRKALASFIKTVAGVGPVGIFTVADRPTILQEYTTESAPLLDASNRLFHNPDSGALLLDGISDVARGLSKRESDRAAIVLVTGEYTEFSNLHYSNVLDRLNESGAMLYAVVLTNPQGAMNTDAARNRSIVLDRGPRESGGMRIDILASMAFEEQLQVVANMLRNQHRVTYARPEALIQPERVEISAVKPGLKAYGAPARGQDEK
jgi:hypothetical protein